MAQVNVRYIVNSVDAALPFYTELLGFEVKMRPAPTFATLQRDSLLLYLNEPGAGGAGQSDDAGATPQPGGWNRFQLVVEDLDDVVARLRERGAHFRTSIVQGQGGRQAVVDDPAGNAVELFEPKRDKAST
jgi:predicted enzyme related to lactoylglutathione lyase